MLAWWLIKNLSQGIGVFCPGGAPLPEEVMASFIDAHRADFIGCIR
jgi:hypothetical protein